MNEIKVRGKLLRSGDYQVYETSVVEVNPGIEINAPSTLFNLIRLRKILREKKTRGFTHTFPLSFDPTLDTDKFKATFPIIFENYDRE